MPEFAYTAQTASGKTRRGVVFAPDESTARTRLRENRLVPIELFAVASGKKRGRATRLRNLLFPIRATYLTAFTRRLAMLIRSGIPLLRGLDVIRRQESNAALKRLAKEVADDLDAGSSLTEALARRPFAFDGFYVGLVRAGETGGFLDRALERIAQYREGSERTRKRILRALAYPSVVLLCAGVILVLLAAFVLPRFAETFDDLLDGRPLPPLTRAVLKIGTTLREDAGLLLAGAATFALSIALARRSSFGRSLFDALRLRLPISGPLLRKVLLARFARTLGTLLESGIPILQALEVVRDALDNDAFSRAAERLREGVREGRPLAEGMERDALFPPLFCGMVGVGEESGQLYEMLSHVADAYEEEVSTTAEALGSIVEPLLILLLAAGVGTMVMAIFLPIVSLLGNVR